jgi:hypothetical protein
VAREVHVAGGIKGADLKWGDFLIQVGSVWSQELLNVEARDRVMQHEKGLTDT